MIDNDLKRKLMEFTQFTQFNLLPFDKQKTKGDPFSKHFWCQDWWDMEVAKCLFQGLDIYPEDHPKRLVENRNFSIEAIKKAAKAKIEIMKTIKGVSGNILVLYHCRRGLNGVIISHIKDWKKIICYDENEAYKPLIDAHLGNRLGLNVEFTTTPPETTKEMVVIENESDNNTRSTRR